jgi:hypothetical protein
VNLAVSIIFVLVSTWFGATFVIEGLKKSDRKPYHYFRARAQMLWKGHADTFLVIVGLILLALAVLVSFGVI